MCEIRAKEREVERLNELRRKVDNGATDVGAATRNRFGRSSSASSGPGDYSFEAASRRHGSYAGGRVDGQRRRMLLSAAFVLYIFALHIIVFIKISF